MQVLPSWPKYQKKQRQISKLLEPRSFNVCKNAIAPMIAILGCSEIDIEVSDADMETVDSDDCREVSRDNEDTNDMLAVTQEKTRFSCKDGWKFIDPFAQSISGLYQMSQLYPRTKEQEESSRVT